MMQAKLEWSLRRLQALRTTRSWKAATTTNARALASRLNSVLTRLRIRPAWLRSSGLSDLADAELQNSYGATNKTDLLVAMLDAAEMSGLSAKIAEISGFDAEEQDDQFNADVESAKNL